MAARKEGATWTIVFNHLPRLEKQMEKRLSQAIRKATFDIQGRAQVNAPVRTGHLKNSITPEIVNPFHGRVSVGADYGFFVNNGTYRTPPNPFFDRAVEAVAPTLIAAVGRLGEGLK